MSTFPSSLPLPHHECITFKIFFSWAVKSFEGLVSLISNLSFLFQRPSKHGHLCEHPGPAAWPKIHCECLSDIRGRRAEFDPVYLTDHRYMCTTWCQIVFFCKADL